MQSCLNSTLICLSYGNSNLFRLSTNPSTASVTVATGVDKSAVQQPSAAPHAKCERMTTGLFQISPSSPGATTTSTTHKMTGGIRRTVSSAAPSTGLGTVNPSARPLQTPATVVKSLSSNTQSARVPTSTHITSSKDPHKKLDRSFSEPAEKKNSAANGAAASSLGPSSRYKTELCRSFAEVGSCKYGDKCQFAHGDEELRTVSRHPKFKTENCKSFHSTGFCPYGPRCHFIHNNEEPKKQSIHMNNTNNQPNGVPSSPSAHSGAQRMFDSVPIPVIGAGAPSATASSQPVTNVPAAFPTASPPAVLAQHAAAANLVRPKALSLGSYSLGSSGEISSPSSQSGSPTSLNSFFTEDNFGLGTPFCLNGSNSRLHSTAAPLNTFPPSIHHHNHHGTFSFSPDSAFVSFNGANSVASSNTGASSNCSGSSLSFGSQKCIFGGSQPTLSSRYSPEPCAVDEATSSVIYSLFGSTPFGTESSQLSDLYRAISPIGKPLHYPISPESPVDSVASEIEALKLGEPQSVGFSPISPSFSTSSLSTASSSPPNGMLSELEALASSFGAVNIPRLPTFTKFAGQLTSAHE